MTISSLIKLLTPPTLAKESNIGEEGVSIAQGIPFPNDYLEFIQVYGTGRIADFITIFNPVSENDDLNFFKQKELIIEDFNYLIDNDKEYYKFTLYPNENGLIPVGVTDNGDYIFWVGSPKVNSNSWTTAIVAARAPDVEYFSENITSFLEAILSKRVKSLSFPNDFPPSKITFESI